MNVKKESILFILLLAILVFSGYTFLSGQEWLKAFINSVSLVMGLVWTGFWINKNHKKAVRPKKRFWQLMKIGIVLYLLSNAIWLIDVVNDSFFISADLSFMIWLGAYIFFLTAFLHIMKIIGRSSSSSLYVFNTGIFILIIAALIVHFLIAPAFQLLEYSIIHTMVTLAYPLLNASLLFVGFYLYYILKNNSDRILMLIVTIAFVVQAASDFTIAYLEIVESGYYPGSILDAGWLASILILGMAGKYAYYREEPAVTWEIREDLKEQTSLFSYTATTILLILVVQSYGWTLNALSLCLSIILLSIMGKNYVMNKNNLKLLTEYKRLAYRDELTGLYNRSSFQQQLDRTVSEAALKHSKVALLLFDLDRFKTINDTLGHFAGDEILMESAYRVKKLVKHPVYRLGGDEFVVVIPEASKAESIHAAENISRAFQAPFLLSGHHITITPSIGISFYPEDSKDSETLLKNADSAMYEAKNSGRNKYAFFTTKLHQALERKVLVEQELKKGLTGNEFSIVYQPKVHLKTMQTTGMEALLRWNSPVLGSVSPAEFIPVAEDTGMISLLGEWVLKEACRQAKEWQDRGFIFNEIAVNVSVHQFKYSNLVQTIKAILETNDVKPSILEIEITESIMQNESETLKVLHELKGLGVKIALDDFGTGYSSLHMLKELPIDTMKIDKSFIDNMENRLLLEAIINIGARLNLQVVAEGVEEEFQVRALQSFFCDYAQGYYFSRPVTPEEAEKHFILKKQSIIEA